MQERQLGASNMPSGHGPIDELSKTYARAVLVNHAQYQMFEAAKARNLEQHLSLNPQIEWLVDLRPG